jgi:hypothetical protein
MPVSIPRFSAVSSSSSEVPMRRHSATNAATAGRPRAPWRADGRRDRGETRAEQRVGAGGVDLQRSNPAGAPTVSKPNCRPWLLPIQFFCISRTFSGQAGSPSIAASSSSAMSEIRKNHWVSSRRSTGAPERQPLPSITCSLASTVMSTGSQFTTAALR